MAAEHAGECRAGKLRPRIGIEDVRPAVTSESILQRLDAERRLHRDRQPPRQHAAGRPVEHDGEIHEAVRHRDIGDVHGPDLVRPPDLDAAQQVRIDLVAGLGLGGARTAIERLYPHPLHQRLHMPAADLAPLGSQQASQHPRAGEGKLQVQPIETLHDREVDRGHWTRQIGHAAAADLQTLCLLGERQIVFTIDHRFALSHPALVSEPSKKSFSSVSSPILACSDFTSTAGVGGVPPPGPKISEALASSCDFHVAIWLGWTSKCSASWAMVRSPLTAARATFALKAGEWFRRGRLLMVSPVRGDYRRRQAEIPLIVLCRFPGPAVSPHQGWKGYVHRRSRKAGGIMRWWRSVTAGAPRPKTPLETRSRICAVSISKVSVHDGRAYFRDRRPITCPGI